MTKSTDQNNSNGRTVDDESNCRSFTVASYNILFEEYTQYFDYSFCPPYALKSSYRNPIIVQEIIQACPHVVCLQEVGYFGWWEETMARLGYRGFYKRRTDASKQDGCAIFFHTSKFELLSYHSLEYGDHPFPVVQGGVANNNVAQMLVLRLKTIGESSSTGQKKRRTRRGGRRHRRRKRTSESHASGTMQARTDLSGVESDDIDKSIKRIKRINVCGGKDSHRQNEPMVPETLESIGNDDGDANSCSRKASQIGAADQLTLSEGRKTAETTGREGLLCVANTHILYNWRRGDLKLSQLQMLCAAIKQIKENEPGSLPERLSPEKLPLPS